jgi:hypothetical protein
MAMAMTRTYYYCTILLEMSNRVKVRLYTVVATTVQYRSVIVRVIVIHHSLIKEQQDSKNNNARNSTKMISHSQAGRAIFVRLIRLILDYSF